MNRRGIFGLAAGVAAMPLSQKPYPGEPPSPTVGYGAGQIGNAVDPLWTEFSKQISPHDNAFHAYWNARESYARSAGGHMDLDLMALRSIPLTQKLRMQRERDLAREAEHSSIRERIMAALGMKRTSL